MTDLADGDERGQGVTHDGQLKTGEPVGWKRRELEGQGDDSLPRPGSLSETAAQGAVCEDGDRKSSILAVPRRNGFDER